MKRHKSLIPLSQDHHSGLMLAQLIKKGAPKYKGLPTEINDKVQFLKQSWELELEPHFDNEERILFPRISGKYEEIDTLVSELKSEHSKIKSMIDLIEQCDNVADSLNSIGLMLEKHIRKEERQLFEKIQSLLPEELTFLEGKITPVKGSCNI